MMMMISSIHSVLNLYFLLFFTIHIPTFVTSTTFTIINKCDFTIWPATLSSSGSQPLDSTGFELSSGDTRSLIAPLGWSGRIWARTGCNFNNNNNNLPSSPCSTGDCGSNQIQCNGATAIPPATLAEFTLGNSPTISDYYDVSLVDGFNLPMVVDVSGSSSSSSSGSCQSTGCVTDLNRQCPDELRSSSNGSDGCKSACEAFGKDEYCCSGEYSNPDKCTASVYSQIFKTACPRAYSYAFDDASSTFTCEGSGEYRITFCPSLTSQKSSKNFPIVDAGIGSGKGPVVSTGDGVGISWLSHIFSSSSSNGGGDRSSPLTVTAAVLTSLGILLLLQLNYL